MATAVVDRLNLERIRQVLRKSPFSAHAKRRNFRKHILPQIAELKYSIAVLKYEAKRVDWTYLTNITSHEADGSSSTDGGIHITNSWELKNKSETLIARVDQILLDLGNLINMMEGDKRLTFENMLDQIRSFKGHLIRALESKDISMLRRLGDFEGVEGETEALVFNCMLSALDEYISQ